MWFYIPAGILIVAFVWWFVHTNAYRQHRAGRGHDPGREGAHMNQSGSMFNASTEFRKND